MEVTNVADKITHAIIGNGGVESFGMSEDAELYHILSSALYSRKKEAVIREILCNAWDAHVEFGLTKTPIKVTLDSEKLSIQDFGPGIVHHMIKPIYGTYGSSTKIKNEKLTGGFGLGTKAPFAYAEHFEVTSCHEGTKSIYRMSKSNAEVGGKPSINTILSVPTTETGLTVSLSVANDNDRHDFLTLIHRIVEMGDMNVILNGHKLRTIPFNDADEGYMFVRQERFIANGSHDDREPIKVRYGHVIYPLPDEPSYNHLKERAMELLELLSKTKHSYQSEKWVLVLQAPAHGISVTPSRESLSITEKTIETLTTMLKDFTYKTDGLLEKTSERMFEDAYDKIGMIGTPEVLYSALDRVPFINKIDLEETNYIYDFNLLTAHYLKKSYPGIPGFKLRHLNMRLKYAAITQTAMPGMIKSLRREVLSNNEKNARRWLITQTMKRVMKGAKEAEIIPANLSFYTAARKTRGYGTEIYHVPLERVPDIPLEDVMPWIRGILVLTHSKLDDVFQRASYFPSIQHWLGGAKDVLCYRVTRSKRKTQLARDHFTKRGFKVIDLTKVQPWETIETTVSPKTYVSPRPRVTGIPVLSAGYDAKTNSFYTSGLFEEGAKRISAPKFIVKISSVASSSDRFDNFSVAASRIIAQKWGNQCGVIQNVRQGENYKAKGASEMREWVVKKVLSEYQNTPEIQAHYKSSISHRDEFSTMNSDTKAIYNIVVKDPVLSLKFGYGKALSKEHRQTIEVYEEFTRWDRKHLPDLVIIDDLVKTWDLDPKAKVFADKLMLNKVVDMIENYVVQNILDNSNSRYKPSDQKLVRQVLITLLER